MLIELLHNHHYTVKESSKGRYMRGLVPLLGGQYSLDLLREMYMIRLLSNARIRKGSAYTLKQLIQIAHPNDNTPRFMTQMKYLTGQGVFLRGYQLKCPTCDLDTWYGLDQVQETVVCQGCRMPFQLPLELDFSYRPNRLLMEAMKAGALTVLLTLHHWVQQSPITIWYAGLEVNRLGQKTDIDLLVQREDGLWMAECKDNFKVDDESIQLLINQLKIGQQIADEIGAHFILATLIDKELPSTLKLFLTEAQIGVLSHELLLQA